jgi:hypothetical protein
LPPKPQIEAKLKASGSTEEGEDRETKPDDSSFQESHVQQTRFDTDPTRHWTLAQR